MAQPGIRFQRGRPSRRYCGACVKDLHSIRSGAGIANGGLPSIDSLAEFLHPPAHSDVEYHEAVDETVFDVECPCCRASLEVDAERRVILSHQPAKPEHVPKDLREAVLDLKSEERTRDERFREQFAAERRQGQDLQKRFDGLLKKARAEGPPKKFTRDIDLD